jgi:hypothetical protein
MKKYLLLSLLLPAALQAPAQPQWKWAKKDVSTYSINPSYPHQVLAVSSGNAFWGVLQNKKIAYSSMALGDNTLRELDSAGNITASLAATGKFASLQAQADAAGNWYVLGMFYDSISLNAGLSLTRDASGTSNNYVLFRLHAHTLVPDWLQVVGGATGSYAEANCFTISNNKLFVPVDSGLCTNVYSYDLATGAATRLWTQSGRSSTALIQADSAGNIYLVGSCVLNGPLNFNGTTPAVPAGIQYAWYVARYHASGQYHWHYYLNDITCNSRSFRLKGNNELYLSGTLSDSASLGGFHFSKPASLFNSDYLVARLDSNGSLVWAQQRPVTGITQGSVFFNTAFHATAVDTSFYMFCETAGNSVWGGGITTSTNSRHLATLASFNANTGNAVWAKTIGGLYTSAQHIVSDNVSIWITGNGSDSNALKFDTVSVATPGPGVYLPYIAKMQVGNKNAVTPPGTSVASPAMASGVRIWPNPASGYVLLDGLTGKERITLQNITGQTVMQALSNGRNAVQLETGVLPRGIYFVEIRSAQSAMISRLRLE